MNQEISQYRATVGLEIHAELNTKTKMFCSCRNDADEKEPNKNICPVCMAHPGTLPVINKEAVRKVLLMGAAIGGILANYTEFDRKSYFYPDIPKGYQLSQYARPLVAGGTLAGVEITRIHLEEDTARSIHDTNSQFTISNLQKDQDSLKIAKLKTENSFVDYNRAGVPLMELVTEPVIHDAETAGRFARELQLLLRYLGAGEANMEKGEMRVEANISVSKETPSKAKESPLKLGTKVEVKNLNSFKSVEKAIAYEVARQSKLLEEGGMVIQETRGWDEAKQVTFSQRKKEGSADYRYFPDPDLPKLLISEIPEFSAEALKKELSYVELPWQVRERMKMYPGITEDSVETFVQFLPWGRFYGAVIEALPAGNEGNELRRIAFSYINNDLIGLSKKELVNWEEEITTLSKEKITPENFASLVIMVGKNKISSRGAKDVLAEMFVNGGEPEVIAKEKGLMQQSDVGTLIAIAQKILDANPTVAADYKAGKEAAMQFLVGQGMRESKGSANPAALKEQFVTLLK